MPRSPLPGCVHCIRVSAPAFGPTVRLVVSPGEHNKGILHMPCGQSGHPLSSNYKDQHQHWVRGRAMSFLPTPMTHTLTLEPASQALLATSQGSAE